MSTARPHRILVAVDDSPRAPHVYSEARDLASRLGSELVVVRAVGISPGIPREALSTSPDQVPAMLARLAEKDLERLVSGEGGVVPRVRIETGVAAEVIRRVADEEDADLVVIGAHGYSPMERVLGTTAARLVNSLHRSVLVVR